MLFVHTLPATELLTVDPAIKSTGPSRQSVADTVSPNREGVDLKDVRMTKFVKLKKEQRGQLDKSGEQHVF